MGLGIKKFICIFALTFLILVKTSTEQSMSYSDYTNKDEVQQVTSSLNQFSLDLYQILTRSTNGNIFFSPFSISTVLAMTYMGTKGNTELELKKALRFPEEKNALKLAYSDLMNDYKKSSTDYELKTSNMIYVSDIMPLLEEFRTTMTKNFLSGAKTVNFSDPEPVRQEINAFVEKETNSKIKDIIPAGLLNDNTRMVLVNAIYFKGIWEHEFNARATAKKPFWITAQQSIMTPMMSMEKRFKISSLPSLDARLLSMSYKGGRISMTILLPNARDGLSEMERKLSTGNVNLASLADNTEEHKVRVTIPKFKLEETLNLVETLKMMGVHDLFNDSKANLSAVAGKDGLYVSDVIHKAFIDVNEEGSEAAAATVVGIQFMSYRIPVHGPFNADRPFMFYIIDKRANQILFLGKMQHPSS